MRSRLAHRRTGVQARGARSVQAASAEATGWTSRAAYEYCALLASAGDVLERDDLGLTDLDRVEGLRYLGRLLQNGLLSQLEKPGPLHPRFASMPPHCGFGLDNPDNVYSSAGVDARRDYRIRGTRGTISYLSFAAQSQNYAATTTITGGAGHLNASQLVLEPDGSFEIGRVPRQAAQELGEIGDRGPRCGRWVPHHRCAPGSRGAELARPDRPRARDHGAALGARRRAPGGTHAGRARRRRGVPRRLSRTGDGHGRIGA